MLGNDVLNLVQIAKCFVVLYTDIIYYCRLLKINSSVVVVVSYKQDVFEGICFIYS